MFVVGHCKFVGEHCKFVVVHCMLVLVHEQVDHKLELDVVLEQVHCILELVLGLELDKLEQVLDIGVVVHGIVVVVLVHGIVVEVPLKKKLSNKIMNINI